MSGETSRNCEGLQSVFEVFDQVFAEIKELVEEIFADNRFIAGQDHAAMSSGTIFILDFSTSWVG